jgi:membrane AbrB-like protein
MPAALSPLRDLLATAETMLVAAAGGITFVFLGIPAGLISGSVLAVAIAGLVGRPMNVPLPLARACFLMTGILLGAIVTPETLHGVATWPLSIALLAVATVCMIVATTSYLRFVHGWDEISAFLGASPGAMAQVLALATEFKADLRGVAIVQVLRVLLVTIGLPGGLALFGLAAGSVIAVPEPPGGSSLVELLILLGVSAATSALMMWLRFPGGLLFGSMAGSGILHGTGLVHAVLPWWVGSSAVLVLGAVAGSRFTNTSFRVVLDYLAAALGSFAVSVSVGAIFISIVTAFLPFPIADVVIAFAPGSQDQMMLLALALHLDPVYVGAHHLARWLVVTFSIAAFSRYVNAGQIKPQEKKRWKRPGEGTFDD